MVRALLSMALVVAAGAGTWIAGARVERMSAHRPAGRDLLFLPNGKQLRTISLGHASTLADLIYLWAIQYYSDYDRLDRYRYVEHVFGNVITELDPHYVDPYWLGSMILIAEAGELEAGLRLLDKGFSNNPDRWILPYLAGWECARAKQYERAVAYFSRAAEVPDAPALVLRVRAGMFTRAGDLRSAIRHWREVLDDPRSDAASAAIAERQLRELEVRADLAELEQAIEKFRNDNGRLPLGLEELYAKAYIARLRDPDGREYRYEPVSGRVSSPAGRVLGGS